jgi:hypothetical protein
MKLQTHALFVLISAILLLGMAASQASELRQIYVVGLDYGGDSLQVVNNSTGEKTHTDVNSGGYFAYGGMAAIGDFEAQATIGYKVSGLFYDAPIWKAYPVDLMLLYRFSYFRVGLGLTKHYAARLESQINANPFTYYEDSTGEIAQIGWKSGDHFSIDLRFTTIKFKEKNVINAPELNGNVIGLYMGLAL